MPTWNTDYTTQSGHEWAKLTGAAGVPTYTMFVRAVAERLRASGTGGYSDPQPGTPVAVGPYGAGPGGDGMPGLANTMLTYGTNYVRAAPYTPDGQPVIDGLTKTVNPNDPADRPPIPFPSGGVTRRWRRAIYSLANPGTAGQRAQFQFTQNRYWWSVPTTDPTHGSMVTTPAAEGKYSGRFMVHDGTTWVESPNQLNPADLVTEAGADWWRKGDLWGPAELNAVRDMANQMTRTIGYMVSTGLNAFIGSEGGFQAGLHSADSDLNDRYAYRYDQPAADTAYEATAPTHSYGPEAGAEKGRSDYDGRYYVHRAMTRFRSPLPDFQGSYPEAPNPDGKLRELSFLVRAVPPTGGEWDTYGDDVLREQWHEVAPRQVTAGTVIQSEVFGTVDGPAPQPWPTSTAYGSARGWTVTRRDCAIVLEWAVPGGFDYSPLSP